VERDGQPCLSNKSHVFIGSNRTPKGVRPQFHASLDGRQVFPFEAMTAMGQLPLSQCGDDEVTRILELGVTGNEEGA
jgi:hypothetical protein